MPFFHTTFYYKGYNAYYKGVDDPPDGLTEEQQEQWFLGWNAACDEESKRED